MNKVLITFLFIFFTNVKSQDLVLQVKENLIKNKVNQVLTDLSDDQEGQIHLQIPSKVIQLKPVSLSELPESVSIYANGLFGLNLENALKMTVSYSTPSAKVKSEIKDLNFKVLNPNKMKVTLNLDINSLKIKIPSIKVSETNIVRNAEYVPGKCSQNKKLAKELWAKASLSVLPKYKKTKAIELKADLFVIKDGDMLKVEFNSLKSNLDSILNSYYNIRIYNLTLPEMFIVKDGDCYPLGTEELENYLTKMITSKISEVITSVHQKLIKEGVTKANESFRKIEFPTSKDINLYSSDIYSIDYNDDRDYKNNFGQVPTPIDNTYVYIPKPVYPKYLITNKDGVFANSEFLKKVFDRVPDINYNISINNFLSIDPNYFGLTLNETMTIDGHTEDNRTYRKKLNTENIKNIKSDFSLSISETVINEKLDLLNNLKVLEKKLPQGFSFYQEKVTTRILENKIYIYSSLKINLNLVDTTVLKAVKYWERVFGSHNGVVYLPVLIKMIPIFDKINKKLTVKVFLSKNQNEIDRLKLKTNKEELAYLVEKILPAIMNYINNKFIDKNEVFSIAKIESESGIIIKDILLVDDSYITILLDLKNIDILLGKMGLDELIGRMIKSE